jgi:hypothetical protein
MISIEEIKELINGMGLQLEENGAFINGRYDGLCLIIYDKDENEASVWNRYNGFKTEEDIDGVRKKIVTWIQILKQQQMDIKMERMKEDFE